MHITVDVNVTHRADPAVLEGLDDLSEQISDLAGLVVAAANATIQREDMIMADLSGVQAAVQQETDVTASAVTLLNQLADQVAALGTDQASVDALADQIRGQASALADAVTANTPAAAPAPTDPGTPVDPGQPAPPVDPLPVDTGGGDVPAPDAPPADVPPVEPAPQDPSAGDPGQPPVQ